MTQIQVKQFINTDTRPVILLQIVRVPWRSNLAYP